MTLGRRPLSIFCARGTSQEVLPENQDQNLALTVLFVPYSPGNGCSVGLLDHRDSALARVARVVSVSPAHLAALGVGHSRLNFKPSTLNPGPETLNPKFETLNSEP